MSLNLSLIFYIFELET